MGNEGGKPHIKIHLPATRPRPGMAAGLREFRFLMQAAEVEVPVWAIISGVTLFCIPVVKQQSVPGVRRLK